MIYFDNAATTKPLEVALKSFIEISENNFANPSSLHKEGKNSRQIIEKSKEEFKKIINANDGELIFTSSATLSNNIAICGYFNYLKGKIKNRKLKILYCEADHPSIVDTIKNLSDIELRGILYPQLYEKLQKYKNKSNYEISGNYKNESETDDIEEYLLSLYYNEIEKFKPDILVLQWVNNENGLILPVEKIARYARKYNENIFIHVDAVQGFLKLPLFILDNIDSVSFSAHKFGGLKGVSSLYIRDIKKIRPIIFGGGQMKNLFPSTENVSAIYSMVQTSIFLFAEISSRIIKNKEKKEYLIKLLSLDEKLYKNLYLFSNNINFSPYIIKIYNNKIPAQILQNILSDENIMVSIGSACSSNRKKELFDFRLYGLPSNLSDKGIRVSLFIGETKEEIEIFISKLSQIISKYSFL